MFYKENNILHEYMDSTVFVVHTVLVIYRGNVCILYTYYASNASISTVGGKHR